MTEPVAMLSNGLKTLSQQLDAERLEPDPSRGDWERHRAAIDDVIDTAERDVLAHLDEAMTALRDNPEAVMRGREESAGMLAEIAALLQASGDAEGARKWLERALSIAPESGAKRDEIAAAANDRDAYVDLVRGRWLLAHRQWSAGDAALKRAARRATQKAVRAAAKRALDGSRPLDGAPTLATINGFGTSLYGSRDRRSDGSYITTLCFAALFIPVFPLKAYRVVSHGGGRYGFISREPLSAFANAARWFVVAAAALGFTGVGAEQWWRSPDHRASQAVHEAQREESRHHAAHALELYERAINEFANTADRSTLAPAALGLVRLASADVHEPMVLDNVDQAGRVVVRYEHLPSALHTEESSALLVSRLQRWQTQIGDATPEAGEASLRLISLAERVEVAPQRSQLEARARAIHVRLGTLLANDWPAEALSHFVAASPDPAALEAAGASVRTLITSPSLVSASRGDLQTWSTTVQAVPIASLTSLAEQTHAALEQAHAMETDTARQTALEQREAQALSETLARYPGDQDTIAALASLRRESGDAHGAIEMLRALGTPGHLIERAQLTLAGALVDEAQLPDAEALLDHLVSTRLPAFQSAQHDYQTAMRAFQERIRAQAQRGELPSDLSDDHFQNENAQRTAFQHWMAGQMDRDTELTRLRQAYEAHSSLVPAALMLATVKLRRANGVSGAPREQLLSQAERLFLAIREEADDVPQFHLGLGQVYHRLGRAADGDREMETLLAGHDPMQSLEVASAYRELGIVTRARQIAQGVYDSATDRERGEAATMLALMADTMTDRETWLRRAPADAPGVHTQLREIEANHLFMAHDYAGADRAYAEVAAAWTEQGGHNPASANNAAIAEQSRYQCTGDRSRLHAAVQGLEAALRLAPESTIVMSNLAEAIDAETVNAILDRSVHTNVLRMDESSASAVLQTLLLNNEHSPLADVVRTHPGNHRRLELARQQQVLAPERAEGYQPELDFYETLDDVDAMRDLDARLQRAAHVDGSARAEYRRRFAAGELDSQMRESLDGELAQHDQVLAAAQRSGHQPTIAVAQLIRSMTLTQRSMLTRSTADADASVQALRDADRLWPELNVRPKLARALLEAAILHVMADSPELAALYQQQSRIRSAETMLYHWVTTEPAAAARGIELLRANPMMVESLALSLALATEHASLSSWALARVFGDAALEHASEPARTRELDRLILSVLLRLEPGQVEAQERLALMLPAPSGS